MHTGHAIITAANLNAPQTGVVDTLFFPDAKLPCRNFRKPGGCRRAQCDYSHEPTNLTRFLDYLASATRTLDICVFTITNDDIADVVLELHRRGVSVRIITDNDQAVTQAVTANNENVVVLSDPAVIRSFQGQFNKLWEMFR
ncbi:PLD1 protein [Gonium pectorale]|uniref:Mitochondrial cardiolipin hydrolase n=1 Tax=Gonium pectorale TaxID=33097 RepID=A0A150GK46_GONPE|nr:PLD1 protein [Gonium pectorale]|eukprot:KXZ50151.1 PLD1 protein [Gonium pectorale]